MVGTVLEAFRSAEFNAGTRSGLVALLIGVVVTLAWRASDGFGGVPIGGLLLSGAVVGGLGSTGLLPETLVLGLAALAIAGLIADVLDTSPLIHAALLVPGALLVATKAQLPLDLWLRSTVTVGIVAGAVLLSDFDSRWGDYGAGNLLLVITAGGLYATVPDTEQALVLLGAALMLAPLGTSLIGVSLGPGGSSAIVGVLAWTAAAGGYHRPSAVVAGIASLGVLAVEPAAGWLSGRIGGPFDWVPTRRGAVAVMFAVQLGLVLLVSRVAGLQESLRVCALVATLVLVGATVAGAIGTRRTIPELRRSSC